MSDFYDGFAGQYDRMVSFRSRVRRESRFFRVVLLGHGVRTVLDCACGTGHHLVMLGSLGFAVEGSDLSSRMVRMAMRNLKTRGVKAKVKVADFRQLSKAFKTRFDAVICVGNSLPHMLSDKDLAGALAEMRKVLAESGILVLHQRNFDLLIKQKMRFVPVAVNADDAFFYVLDYFPRTVTFNVVHLRPKSGKFSIHRTEYSLLTKPKLAALLRKSGFGNLAFYGDHKFKKFDVHRDKDLIITAQPESPACNT